MTQPGYERAVGLIETRGLVAALEAADAMCKAARVELKGRHKADAGLMSVLVEGDVGAVKSAVSAGAQAAAKVGELVSQHVIPMPYVDILPILPRTRVGSSPSLAPKAPAPVISPTDLAALRTLSVAELRRLARSLPAFPLSGRAISAAQKDELVAAFEELARNSP
ncbi:MAG: BMC domain-containing protein [Planctomycetota bacterium]